MDDLASNIVQFVNIYKELSTINQNISQESLKLNSNIQQISKQNTIDCRFVEVLIAKKQDELKKLKNLYDLLNNSKHLYDDILHILPLERKDTKVEPKKCMINNETNTKIYDTRDASTQYDLPQDPRDLNNFKKKVSFEILNGFIEQNTNDNPLETLKQLLKLSELAQPQQRQQQPVVVIDESSFEKPLTPEFHKTFDEPVESVNIQNDTKTPKNTLKRNTSLENILTKRFDMYCKNGKIDKKVNDIVTKQKETYGDTDEISQENKSQILSSVKSLLNYDLCKQSKSNFKRPRFTSTPASSSHNLAGDAKRANELEPLIEIDSIENLNGNNNNDVDIYADLDEAEEGEVKSIEDVKEVTKVKCKENVKVEQQRPKQVTTQNVPQKRVDSNYKKPVTTVKSRLTDTRDLKDKKIHVNRTQESTSRLSREPLKRKTSPPSHSRYDKPNKFKKY